jgi:hypothetical protein
MTARAICLVSKLRHTAAFNNTCVAVIGSRVTSQPPGHSSWTDKASVARVCARSNSPPKRHQSGLDAACASAQALHRQLSL